MNKALESQREEEIISLWKMLFVQKAENNRYKAAFKDYDTEKNETEEEITKKGKQIASLQTHFDGQKWRDQCWLKAGQQWD